MARTTPPEAAIRANRPKPDPANCAVTSVMRSGLRRSGLSEPNSSIAVSYGMRWKGGSATARPAANSSNTPAITGSMVANTSSWVT